MLYKLYPVDLGYDVCLLNLIRNGRTVRPSCVPVQLVQRPVVRNASITHYIIAKYLIKFLIELFDFNSNIGYIVA
jgi:hypothetical protein